MRFFLASVLFFSSIIPMGCTKEPLSEEEVIKGIIEAVADAAENKDIPTIRKALSKAYRDSQGNDYDALNGFLLSHFFRSEKIGVTATVSQVTVGHPGHPPEVGRAGREKARSHTEAILSRVPQEAGVTGYIARDADYYRFDLEWQKEEGEWRVLSASWGPMEKIQ